MKHALSEYARTKLATLRDNTSDDAIGCAWRELLSDFVHHARYLGLDAVEGEQRGEIVFRLRRGSDRIAFQMMRGCGQPRVTTSAPCSCERLTERLAYDATLRRLVDRQGREPMDALVEEVCVALGAVPSVAPYDGSTSTSSVRAAIRPSQAVRQRASHSAVDEPPVSVKRRTRLQ